MTIVIILYNLGIISSPILSVFKTSIWSLASSTSSIKGMTLRRTRIVFDSSMLSLFVLIKPEYSYAVDPEEFLTDNKQELRARHISKNIRCMICQNQSIDESSSPLAKDLRTIIRQKITEGSTDKEIYNFLTSRYGDFILLNPPLKKSTFFLWFFPLIMFILSILVFYKYYKKSLIKNNNS